MFILKSFYRWIAAGAAAAVLAGCASNPAPVANYSFGPGRPAAQRSAVQPAAGAAGGARTFGLGGHANGTLSAAGYTVAPCDTLYSIAFANGMDVRELAALNDIPPPYVIHRGQVLKLKSTGAAPAAPTVIAGSPTALPQPTTPAPATAPPQPSAPVFGPVETQSLTAAGVAPAKSSSIATTAGAAPVTVPVAGAASPTSTTISPPVPAAAVPTPPPGATRSVAGIAWQWPASGKVLGGFQPGAGGDGAGLNIAGNMGEPVRAAAAGTVVYSGNGLIGYGELVIIKHNDTYLSAYGHNSKRLVKEGERVSAGQEIALMGASGAPRIELHFEIRKDGKPVDPLGYLPAR